MSAGYDYGGKSTVDGMKKDDRKKTWLRRSVSVSRSLATWESRWLTSVPEPRNLLVLTRTPSP